MTRNLLESGAREAIIARLRRLTPESRPLWGTLDAARCVAHLSDSFRITFGELTPEFKPNFLSTPLGRWLIIESPMPWPKAKIKVPPVFFTTPPPADFTEGIDALVARVERFARPDQEQWGASPAFGNLSPAQWARLGGRHLDHHLRQFGC